MHHISTDKSTRKTVFAHSFCAFRAIFSLLTKDNFFDTVIIIKKRKLLFVNRLKYN